MSENQSDRSIEDRASVLAAELSEMAAELQDSDQSERARRLTAALSRAIRREDASERGRMMAEVESRCPAVKGLAVEGVDQSDPWLLLGRLRDAAGSMNEDQRREAATLLAAAGIAPPAAHAGTVGPEGESRVREAFGLDLSEPLDADRTADLASMLAGPVIALETLAWRTWRSLAPESELRRLGELQSDLAAYARGDDVSREGLVEDLAKFRQLMGSLLASVSRAGDVASARLNALDPVQIRGFSESEKKWNESVEAACWRKYEQLYKEVDPSNIDGALRQAFAEYAGGLLKVGHA